MGEVRTKVRLTNSEDLGAARRGLIKSEEVRTVEVEAVVDTGARRMTIPEDIVETLGIPVFKYAMVTYANSVQEKRPIVGPIMIEIGDRAVQQDCVALAVGTQPLIGQLVLEGMDLVADCTREKLAPAHPESDLPVNRV